MTTKRISEWHAHNRLSIVPVFFVSVLIGVSNLRAQAIPIITEQTNPALSDNYFSAGIVGLKSNGDLFFGGGAFSLSYWNAGTGVRTRLLQVNDPLPGFSGSIANVVAFLPQMNAMGHVAMVNAWSAPGVRDPSGIFVYDGAQYRKVALSGEATPGIPDHVFAGFTDLRINGNDQVAFIAQIEPPEAGLVGIFLGSLTGPPVKIATPEELRPVVGHDVSANLQLIGVDDSGNVALLGDDGSSYNYTIIIVSASGVRRVIRSGDAAPGTGGLFALPSSRSNLVLNAGGSLAFFSNVFNSSTVYAGMFFAGTTGSVQAIALTGQSTGTSLGGTYNGFTFRGFNDNGQVLYAAGINGSSTTNNALFLKTGDAAPEVLCYVNQTIQGGPMAFNGLQGALLSPSGKAAVAAPLKNGTSPRGIFLVSASDAPQIVVLQGIATPIGGTYGQFSVSRINSANQVAFRSDILGLNANGIFLWTSGSTQSVVSTTNTIPANANPALLDRGPYAGDHELIFWGYKGEGKDTIFTKSLRSGDETIRRVIGDGDAAPGGGVITFIDRPAINNQEEIVILSSVIGGSVYPASALWISRPGSGLSKIVMTGDKAPGAAAGTFDVALITGEPRINNSSQVAFIGTVSGSTSTSGVFLILADGTMRAIARKGDSSPAGGTFQSFSPPIWLNDAGQVVFRATSQTNNLTKDGLFLGTGTATPVKLVAQGDSLPNQDSVNQIQGYSAINSVGQVACLLDAHYNGIFLLTAGAAPSAIVRQGDTTSIQNAGSFADFSVGIDVLLAINNSGQVAFWAAYEMAGGIGGFGTGIFVGSAGSSPVARIYSGKALPGGGAYYYSLPVGSTFALSDSGELALYVQHVSGAGDLPRYVVSRPGGELVPFAAVGTDATGTGSKFGRLGNVGMNSTGSFFLNADLIEGAARQGIFRFGSATNVPPGKATLVSPSGRITTHTPAYVWNAVSSSSYYQIWIRDSNSSNFTAWYTAEQVGCATGTGTCSVTLSNSLPTGAAQWWIQTWNTYGYGPWSDAMSFEVAAGGVPAKAVLISPSGTINTSTPTYTWNAVAESSWYQLWVNDSGGAGKIVTWFTAAQAGCSSGTGTCSVTPATALASGAATWWIQTWNSSGDGPWSDGMSFVVGGGGLPGKATLVSPTGNVSTANPTYTWNAVSNATWYQLWVNDSAASGKIIAWYTAAQAGCASGTGMCSVTPATGLAAGAAQWWIQTWNAVGYGPWSDGMSFTVTSVSR